MVSVDIKERLLSAEKSNGHGGENTDDSNSDSGSDAPGNLSSTGESHSDHGIDTPQSIDFLAIFISIFLSLSLAIVSIGCVTIGMITFALETVGAKATITLLIISIITTIPTLAFVFAGTLGDQEETEDTLEPLIAMIPAPIYRLIAQGYTIWGVILNAALFWFCDRIDDVIELYDWVCFLWQDHDFMFRIPGEIPHFIPRRDLAAAKERIVAAYLAWEGNLENEEPLILEGEDMKMILRKGYDVEDVLVRAGAIDWLAEEGPNDLEDESIQAAFEKADRVAEGLGPEAAVFMWKGPKEFRLREVLWVLVLNDWEEDVEEVFRQRMREREEDLWRELDGWLNALAIVCLR
ncbi:hypothetical protein B0T21DRAFT_345592 [Apiosordaria backusii]|uniref:Uncharacterized protein n=1 Tax=Apiosordaria backusii TaxID=314023 RepID=A0AA40ELV0_9PEZI|nr:hypothetical protein B0T21DRAFT_345592 [Apiosordaria backusii]